MMKKMLFLMLFLMFLGIANVSSQVRIGGNEKPNDAAVLDLNVDNNTNTGTKGLALPRVSLSDNTAKLGGVTPVNGMIVYNTSGTLPAGVYYWSGNAWVRPAPDSPVDTAFVGLGTAIAGDQLKFDGSHWVPVPAAVRELVTITCDSCYKMKVGDWERTSKTVGSWVNTCELGEITNGDLYRAHLTSSGHDAVVMWERIPGCCTQRPKASLWCYRPNR